MKRFDACFILLLAALASSTLKAQPFDVIPPELDQIHTDEATGKIYRLDEVFSAEADLTGDGVKDQFTATNVSEILWDDNLGSFVLLPKPEYSGVWATYSQDVQLLDEAGMPIEGEVLRAGTQLGPHPRGWIVGGGADFNNGDHDAYVQIEDATDPLGFREEYMTPIGNPIFPDDPDDPIGDNETGQIVETAFRATTPCNHYGCDYFNKEFRFHISENLQTPTTVIEVRLYNPYNGALFTILNATMADINCSGASCVWPSGWCEPRPGTPPPGENNAIFDYEAHLLAPEAGLYSTERKGLVMWCR